MPSVAPTACWVLVGNKVDLRENPDMLAKLRERGEAPVSYEEGKALANEIDAVGYFENSALTQQGFVTFISI